MKIGVCVTDYQTWPIVGAGGYDYIEGNLGHIAAASDEEYAEIVKAAKESGIPVETTNCFFPRGFALYAFDPVTGEGTDEFADVLKNVAEYADKAFSRVVPLGLKVAVLGSGGNRKLLPGIKPEVAEAQFIEVLKVVGDVADKYGIKIAIEPLSDCNFIVTLAEGMKFVKAANHPAVGILNDFFHSAANGEDITTSLKDAADMLYHMHIACPESRKMPTIDDKDIIFELCDELKKTGYDARISLEGKSELPFEEMIITSYEVMKLVR